MKLPFKVCQFDMEHPVLFKIIFSDVQLNSRQFLHYQRFLILGFFFDKCKRNILNFVQNSSVVHVSILELQHWLYNSLSL